MVQDLMNRQSGNVVAPDTTGVGFYFLMDFVTPEMSCDFALIEQDFLKNCRGKLDEFREAGWYEIVHSMSIHTYSIFEYTVVMFDLYAVSGIELHTVSLLSKDTDYSCMYMIAYYVP